MLRLEGFKAVEISSTEKCRGGQIYYTTLDGVERGDARDYETGQFYARNAQGRLVADQ